MVGAGVAGATIARLLAKRGHSVLLVEKKQFPRYKVCGCCLNLRSLRHLDEWGITEKLNTLGAPTLDSLALHSGGQQAQIPLPGGMAVSRDILDYTLAEVAIEGGAVFLPGTTASLTDSPIGPFRSLCLEQGEVAQTVTARLVIAADGLGSKLLRQSNGSREEIAARSYIGMGAQVVDTDSALSLGRIHLYCSAVGYVGAVRIEENKVAFAAALHPKRLRDSGTPADSIQSIYGAVHQEAPACLEGAKWQGTPPLTRRAPTITGERLVALGDAGGYVEPFTGEGMAWAMDAAAYLDEHLATYRPAAWDQASATWEGVYKKKILPQRIWCRSISTALRFPRLTTSAVACLSWMPSLSSTIVSAINRPKPS